MSVAAHMTPDEFTTLGSRLFTRPGAASDHGWQTRAAQHFQVNDRTVRAWISGRNPVPEGVARELRAMVAILPPPQDTTSEDDRDEAMRAALHPALDRMTGEYERAGWHEAEILAATLDYTVGRMIDGAGTAATVETLEAAARSVRAIKAN